MGRRLLVVAPHPDDESLGAGGLIAKARERGDEVFVVLFTVGDGFFEDAARYYLSLEVKPEEFRHMGYERQRETAQAMAELGVQPDHVLFLGFPDGGLDALWRTHWQGVPWTSPTTGYSAVTYLDAVNPRLPYTGVALLSALMTLYTEIQPDMLVMPSAFDVHPDHWACNAFATLAWAELARTSRQWQHIPRRGYLVHWPTWPFPLAYRPHTDESVPRALTMLGQEPWVSEPLADNVVACKRQALIAHESQAELIRPFMMAFCHRTEAFSCEDEWSPERHQRDLTVSNPPNHWRMRVVRKHNPLAWGRYAPGEVRDQLTLGLDNPSRRVEVSLHPVDGSHAHYQWYSDALPDGVEIATLRHRLVMSWPAAWRGQGMLMMAGVQVYDGSRCLGKIPFRPWPVSDERTQ